MSYIRQLPENTVGRDFVVGDLHGEIGQLRTALHSVNFDDRIDRVFSVGDLVDRGADSLGSLRLLNAPWFYAVQGNHERMMCEHLLGGVNGFCWELDDGRWSQYVEDANEMSALAEIARALPFVIQVGSGPWRFQVVHAEIL